MQLRIDTPDIAEYKEKRLKDGCKTLSFRLISGLEPARNNWEVYNSGESRNPGPSAPYERTAIYPRTRSLSCAGWSSPARCCRRPVASPLSGAATGWEIHDDSLWYNTNNLVGADVSKHFKVKVTFQDNLGLDEELTSKLHLKRTGAYATARNKCATQ